MVRTLSPTWQSNDKRVQLYLADSLAVLGQLPTASVDALVTDPPYSSGGRTAGERRVQPSKKYERSDIEHHRPDFSGDGRDQRSWGYWVALWLSQGLRLVTESGYCLMFSDWRQLPRASDALQAGGFKTDKGWRRAPGRAILGT